MNTNTTNEPAPELLRDRLKARRAGAIYWLPTTPCPRGHIAPTKVYGRNCTACDAEDVKKAEAAKRAAAAKARRVARIDAAKEAEREAKKRARQEEKEAAKRAKAQAKAAATREANKAAREAAARQSEGIPQFARESDQVEELAAVGQAAVYAVRDEGSEWGEEVPW